MRSLTRNKRSFSYCLRQSANAEVVDANSNRTGEYIPVYADAVEMTANVSPASGYSQTEQFGDLTDYDHVIVTTDMDCPITESTVLFLEKAPAYRQEDIRVIIPGTRAVDPSPEIMTAKIPLYDYIVRRVSKSLHGISIAVSKAEVK